MTFFALPATTLITDVLIGIGLAVIYLFLLWTTVTHLKKTAHKGLILLLSAIIRIFLVLWIAVQFSQQSPSQFLYIMLGFILTRFILVGIIQNRGQK